MRPVGKVRVCLAEAAGATCETYCNGFRDRSTGPEFPIQIMGCRAHKGSFTVYPTGFEPYGRVRLAPVDAAGAPLEGERSEPALQASSDRRWEGTLFRRRAGRCRREQAAVVARAGKGC